MTKCESSCLNNSWRTTPIWCNWNIQSLDQGGVGKEVMKDLSAVVGKIRELVAK